MKNIIYILAIILFSIQCFAAPIYKEFSAPTYGLKAANKMWIIDYNTSMPYKLIPFVHKNLNTIPCTFSKDLGTPILAINSGFFFGPNTLSKVKIEDTLYEVKDPRPFVQHRRALGWYPFKVFPGDSIDSTLYDFVQQGMSLSLEDLGTISDGDTSRTMIWVENKNTIHIIIVDNQGNFSWVKKTLKALFPNFNESTLVNLDGGGSTTLKIYSKGCKAVNYLRDGDERSIKSFLVLFKR